MEWEALQPEDLATPKAPYSPTVVAGELVLTAGQVAIDASGELIGDGIEAQARQAFENVGRCLGAAGCRFADVIKVSVFLADLGDFEIYNDVYRQYFFPPYPARTTVQAGLAPGLRIEVEAIAQKSPEAPVRT